MISLGEIVCPKCSGKLVKKGRYALCTKCGKKWVIESHANGSFKSMRCVDDSGGDLDKILVIRDDLLKLYNIASYYRPNNEDLNKIRKRIKELYEIG